MYSVAAEQMFNVLLENTMVQVQEDLKKKFYSEAEV
jgi:hypothetical protein